MLQTEFGTIVKETRKNHSFSQEQLSTLSGIERGQISKIENGQINVTLDTIERLAKALQVQPKILVPDMHIDQRYEMHPFVKWAGGKTQILDKINGLLPENWNHYFEPFVGGGALFFSLCPVSATINDFNEELVDVYRCLADDESYQKLITLLEEHEQEHSEDYYMQIRAMDRDPGFGNLPSYVRAARMVYLNKACFNGLYRVNAKGYFNVPSGKKEKVVTFDRNNLQAIHSYFSKGGIQILQGDFEKSVESAKAGDFVYFDPPYDVYKADGFTAYTGTGFGPDEQKRLASVYCRLSEKGVKCLLSNHNTPLINDLYKKYKIHVILAKRMINSDASGRGDVEEVLVSNY
jgi:DNA adenine methylase